MPNQSFRGRLVESLEVRQLLTAGVPDAGFSGDGFLLTDLPRGDYAHAVGAGKVVIAGADASDVVKVERFLPNGNFDSTFDGDGKATLASTYYLGFASLLQRDGKLVLSVATKSTSAGYLVRFNTNGSLDTTFGNNGFAASIFGVGSITKLVEQPDGKILALGSDQPAANNNPTLSLARYNATGQRDYGFGDTGNGMFRDLFRIGGRFSSTSSLVGNGTVGVLPDGKILVMANAGGLVSRYGTFFYRLTSYGTVDSTFNYNNFTGSQRFSPTGTDDQLHDMVVLSDGSVVGVGFAGSYANNGVWKWRPATGSTMLLDPTFDGDGTIANGAFRLQRVMADNNGRIVGLGSQIPTGDSRSSIITARYRLDGSLDPSYGVAGTGKWSGNFNTNSILIDANIATDDNTVTAMTLDSGSSATLAYGLIKFGGESIPDTTPPTARPGGPYSVGEGNAVDLRGDGSSDVGGSIVKYEWDFDYDGVTFTADSTLANPYLSAGFIDGPQVLTLALRVTDTAGLVSPIATAMLSVVNQRPTATFASAGAVTVGSPSVTQFTNQSDRSADYAAGFKYSYDFNNDGDFTDTGDIVDSTLATANYTYPSTGTFIVRGRITDKDGGYSDYTTSVTVNPTTPATINEVILDNNSPTVTFTGAWGVSSGVAGYYGSDYRHDNKANKGQLSAKYTATLTAGQRYEVYAWWPARSDRSPKVPFDVAHSGGTSTVTKDQRTNGKKWNLLGTYTFGTTASVTIRNAGTTGYVGADAVRFVRVTTTPPPVTLTTFRVNAGGSAYTTSGGKSYSADTGFTGGSTTTSSTVDVTNTTDDTLYRSRRHGKSFAFSKTAANGNYVLRLHFAELVNTAVGKRTFNVSGEGKSLLSNFDIYASAGGAKKATVKEFAVTIADGKLDVQFTGLIGEALVSAIELVPV